MAVDFNKSGTPVSIDSLPRPRTSYRPDFNARETDVAQAKLGTEYYESRNILGQLFRSVEVPKPPVMETRQHPRWTPQQPLKPPSSEDEPTSTPSTPLHRALERFLPSLPRVGALFTSHPSKPRPSRTALTSSTSSLPSQLSTLSLIGLEGSSRRERSLSDRSWPPRLSLQFVDSEFFFALIDSTLSSLD